MSREKKINALRGVLQAWIAPELDVDRNMLIGELQYCLEKLNKRQVNEFDYRRQDLIELFEDLKKSLNNRGVI